MLGVQIKDSVDRGLPGGKSLFRQAIDQIQIQVSKAGFPRGRHSLDDIKEIVDAFQHPQFFGIRGLNTVTDAVDSDSPKLGKVVVRDSARVCLYGDLGVLRKREVAPYTLENSFKLIRGEKGWGSTPKEDGVRFDCGSMITAAPRSTSGLTNNLNFLTECIHIGRDHFFLPC